MSTLQEFFRSDVQSISLREKYLGYAHNVKLGHHHQLQLTGNAFHVQFSTKKVLIENLWDDDADPIELNLDDFISILSNWRPNT
jgi:hypothetical protein